MQTFALWYSFSNFVRQLVLNNTINYEADYDRVVSDF
jgi:hypothetical protein